MTACRVYAGGWVIVVVAVLVAITVPRSTSAQAFPWEIFGVLDEPLRACLSKDLDADELETLAAGKEPVDDDLRTRARQALLACAAARARSTVAPAAAPTSPAPARSRPAETVRFVDSLAHASGAAAAIAAQTDRLGIDIAVTMPPPTPPERGVGPEEEDYVAAARSHPDRFVYVGGGIGLNAILQDAVRAGTVTDAVRTRFRQAAAKLIADGAKGFGELALLHLSLDGPQHPYLSTPPDHPLLLLLADIAADAGVPITVHMEAVPDSMATPTRISGRPNPNRLMANIDAFATLLAHNPKARIVWAHAGWDNTGSRTVELMRRLMAENSNLFMSIKIERKSRAETRPLDNGGALREEWLALFEAFPDRFVIGSDETYDPQQGAEARNTRAVRQLLEQLPEALARRFGQDNPRRLYGL